MFHPEPNPSLNPNTSGKARSYVDRTDAIRPVRLDHDSDHYLGTLRHHLHNPANPHDMASVSMVIRRALYLYYGRLLSILRQPSLAAELEKERHEVRKLTKKPGRKPRKTVTNPTTSPLTINHPE